MFVMHNSLSIHGVVTAVTVVFLILFINHSDVVCGWNVKLNDAYGICNWTNFAPTCQAPPQCPSSSLLSSEAKIRANEAVQYSPVNFTEEALKQAKVGPSLNISIVSPLVVKVDKATGKPVENGLIQTIAKPRMMLRLTPGEVVSTVCRTETPLHLLFTTSETTSTTTSSMDKSQSELTTNKVDENTAAKLSDSNHNKIANEDIKTKVTETYYEVMSILIYGNTLHFWPETRSDSQITFPTELDIEMEFHLKRVEPRSDVHSAHLFNSATSVNGNVQNEKGTTAPIFSSVCFDYLANRAAPDVILSAFLLPAENVQYSSNNLFTVINNALIQNINVIMEGSTTHVNVDPLSPFLSFDNGTSFSSHYYQYTGSLAHPPCSTNVQRILFTQQMTIPIELINAYQAILGIVTNNAYNNFTQNLLSNTVITHGTVSVVNNNYDENKNENDKVHVSNDKDKESWWSEIANSALFTGLKGKDTNENSSSWALPLIATLITVNLLLLSYLLILCFARKEYIAWPIMLGGLNHPVEFYARAYKELGALREAGLKHDDTNSNEESNQTETMNDDKNNNKSNNINYKTAHVVHGHHHHHHHHHSKKRNNIDSKKQNKYETSSDSNSNNGISSGKAAKKNRSGDDDEKNEMIRRAMEF